MNYIKHLTSFFSRIGAENSITPTHISLYIAIFQCWNVQRFRNPVLISRQEIMTASKIQSCATYHKCIKELHRLGFLIYQPSCNPFSKTSIIMHTVLSRTENGISKPTFLADDDSASRTINNEVEPDHFPTTLRTRSKNAQVDDQAYIYNTNSLKTIKTKDDKYISPPENYNSKKSDQQVEDKIKIGLEKQATQIPELSVIREYFLEQKSTLLEAERFFNYYESNGWLIGGKTKMHSWTAAVRNWILTTKKFTANTPQNQFQQSTDRAQNLRVTVDKDYSEPL